MAESEENTTNDTIPGLPPLPGVAPLVHAPHVGDGVGRRGTNQLCLVKRYLDVLVKHTTKIPPLTALVEVRPRLP